jgi:hypothetical protein
MPGYYSTHRGHRPCAGERTPLEAPARLFVCVRCRAQVLICSCCDRGQIYCAGSCAREARHQAQRAAGRRYQTSRRGRVRHAARAGRYRARPKNVTHQGSPLQRRDDGVSAGTVATTSKSAAASVRDVAVRSRGHGPGPWRCHWCEYRCPPLVRIGFLRRRRRGASGGRTWRRA